MTRAPADVNSLTPEEVLSWVFASFERPVIVASLQAGSSVLIDMAARIKPDLSVITLDTGRLPEATHRMIDRVRDRYRIDMQVWTPAADEIRAMTAAHGTNLFFKSPDLRRFCCEVRKDRTMSRALAGHDAWITGLRRDQLPTRAETPVVSTDLKHGGIVKVAPLATWAEDQVWAHIRANDVPYHELYDHGYASIGCEPCTRAIRPGEDQRAGRWWWEAGQGEVKECGIHWSPSGRPEPVA